MLNRRDTLRGLALTIGIGTTGWAERALAALELETETAAD